jgi:hypothetical protein
LKKTKLEAYLINQDLAEAKIEFENYSLRKLIINLQIHMKYVFEPTDKKLLKKNGKN